MTFKEILKELWNDQREVPFTSGPWWAALNNTLYALLVGANLFSAGAEVGRGEDPTTSLVFAGVILVLGIAVAYLNWSGAYSQGQTKVYKQHIEHDRRLLDILRGTYETTETETHGK